MQWGTGGDLREGETERILFADPGLYPYTCYYHPGMSGVIVVGDGVFTDARTEVSRSISQAQERAQVSNRPSSGSVEPSTAEPQVASTLAPEGGDDNPLLFAAMGVLIGAVAVSLVVAAKGMRKIEP
jgi:hypothetical protein